MREEVTNKILLMLQKENIDIKNIQLELTIILNDYEISPRETALAVGSEDRNRWYMQRFLVAKTVSGRSDRTLQYYRIEVSKILQKINKPADEITTDDIRYYLALRQKRDGISKVTANNELRCLRAFYGFLTTEELILKNPCLRIEQIKTDKTKKKALSEMDVEKVRDSCLSTREKAIIEVLLSTGCRVTELTLMRIDDLDGDKLIVHGKGGKDRLVYLNAKAIMALQQYLTDRKDTNPYIFPAGYSAAEKNKAGMTHEIMRNWYKYPEKVHPERPVDKASIESTVRKIGKRAGVANVHPHRLRRTCATFALRRGMPIEQVSKMLGHEQIGTTQIYLDLSDDELQQAHKKYVG